MHPQASPRTTETDDVGSLKSHPQLGDAHLPPAFHDNESASWNHIDAYTPLLLSAPVSGPPKSGSQAEELYALVDSLGPREGRVATLALQLVLVVRLARGTLVALLRSAAPNDTPAVAVSAFSSEEEGSYSFGSHIADLLLRAEPAEAGRGALNAALKRSFAHFVSHSSYSRRLLHASSHPFPNDETSLPPLAPFYAYSCFAGGLLRNELMRRLEHHYLPTFRDALSMDDDGAIGVAHLERVIIALLQHGSSETAALIEYLASDCVSHFSRAAHPTFAGALRGHDWVAVADSAATTSGSSFGALKRSFEEKWGGSLAQVGDKSAVLYSFFVLRTLLTHLPTQREADVLDNALVRPTVLINLLEALNTSNISLKFLSIELIQKLLGRVIVLLSGDKEGLYSETASRFISIVAKEDLRVASEFSTRSSFEDRSGPACSRYQQALAEYWLALRSLLHASGALRDDWVSGGVLDGLAEAARSERDSSSVPSGRSASDPPGAWLRARDSSCDSITVSWYLPQLGGDRAGGSARLTILSEREARDGLAARVVLPEVSFSGFYCVDNLAPDTLYLLSIEAMADVDEIKGSASRREPFEPLRLRIATSKEISLAMVNMFYYCLHFVIVIFVDLLTIPFAWTRMLKARRRPSSCRLTGSRCAAAPTRSGSPAAQCPRWSRGGTRGAYASTAASRRTSSSGCARGRLGWTTT